VLSAVADSYASAVHGALAVHYALCIICQLPAAKTALPQLYTYLRVVATFYSYDYWLASWLADWLG
jgi:hypothetical protein